MNFRAFKHLTQWLMLLTLMFSMSVSAQIVNANDSLAEVKFEHFNTEGGLNQNSITRLFMDSAGMLWIGTQDGLHSYNGVDFNLYLKKSNNSNSISGNFITDILQSPDGDLWVGTYNDGLNKLNLTTGQFTQYKQEQGLADLQITNLSVIGDTLWIGTHAGLYLLPLKTGKITPVNLGANIIPDITSLANVDNKYIVVGTETHGTFAIDSNTIIRLDIPTNMSVNQIKSSSLYSVWLAIDNQIWRYNLDTHERELIWSRGNNYTENRRITDFTVVNANQIFAIGQNTGLFKLDNIDGQWVSSVYKHNPQTLSSISANTLQTLMLDPSGTLWIGTGYSGIDKLNINQQFFSHYYDYQTGSPGMANMIRTVFRDDQQRLWIGTDGAGVKYLQPHDAHYYYINALFANKLSLPIENLALTVHDIAQDKQGLLWFATNLGLFTLDSNNNLEQVQPANEKFRADTQIRSLVFDNKDRLWIATSQGLYFISEHTDRMMAYNFGFQSEYSPYKHQIITLHFSQDYLWLGTMGGVVRLDPEKQQLNFLTHDPDNDFSLSDNRVRDFLLTENGDFWVATHGGIDKLTVEYGSFKFERMDVNADNSSNTIYAILEDDQHDLWLSTNSGISRFNPSQKSFMAYNVFEGLQANEFNGAAKFKEKDGSLWFGGIRGLNYFDPEKIPSQRPENKLALTKYTIGETQYPILDLSHAPNIVMPFEKQVITFEIGSLNFNYPGLSRFSYKLDGLDNEWHNLNQGNHITYTNLSPGEYTLMVRHALGTNQYSQYTLNVKVSVVPPIYMTVWAYILYGTVGLLIVLSLLLSRQKKLAKQREFDSSIRASEERLKLALWASGDGMWDWNIKDDKVYRTNMVEPTNVSLKDQLLTNNVHPEDKSRVEQLLDDHLNGDTEFFEAEYRVETKPGQWSWLLDRGQVVERDSHNTPIRMAGTHKDITSRKLTENELKLSSQVLFSMNEAVVVGELDYKVRSVNPAFSRITGFKHRDVVGKHFLFLTMGKQSREFYNSVETQLLRHKHWAGEINIRTRDRRGILAWLEINQVIDNKGETSHFVAVFTDITARKKAEEDLRVLANFDPLTGLPNRTLFQDRLNHALTKAIRAESMVALLFLDLDRFKHINDSMGHHIGDLLLKAVASRLQNSVREGDTVARLGGDEFTIILEGVAKTKAATIIAEKVLKAFQTPFLLDDKVLTISPSIGISLYPDDADDTTSLIKYADTAMYHAKSLGRNNYQFYTEKLNQYATRHVQLEAGLKKALQDNEFHLVYQPKYNVETQQIVGLEALLRWESQELGIISPVEFIPLAEETGMINQIGNWAINQACCQLALWHGQGFEHISVAVNLSARQLKADIISTIEVALAVSGLPAHALELELTESMIMGNPQDSVAVLSQLKALGLTIAIDDFGTGYSSLSYLKRFPIDTLKIDQEFVRDITEDPDDAAITSAIITLAHSLELNVVAEGVETQEQLNFLRDGGCDQVQGFLLSKPLTAINCLALLNQEKNS
ncbi:EAL domain-containing protein [Shewanella saliphila]|uniref:Diguanylate cyclase n=3 Tax=Shewanella TaxID=22 RepID=A0ABQ2QB61_9GAMM|nr:EAL domain-containing protein [Shewanella saliphila]MCL1102488.1 EAL domain-containing protein [Shewanella saliphila]GGP64025.1 diguanylate cyclase [Shewanella saliphila]